MIYEPVYRVADPYHTYCIQHICMYDPDPAFQQSLDPISAFQQTTEFGSESGVSKCRILQTLYKILLTFIEFVYNF